MSEGTRRDLARRGLSAALAAGLAPPLLRAGVAVAVADTGDDGEILQSAIAVEQAALLAYRTGLGSGLLEKPVAEIAKQFGEQERRHLEALAEALRGLGGTVPEAPAMAEIEGLAGLSSQSGFLALAIGLENMAVSAYGQAQRKLESPELLRLATQISSNEGQHLVVLRQALGAGPVASVPVAFEAGVSPAPKPEAG